MQALLIGAGVLLALGALLIYGNQRLAAGRARAEAERDQAEGNQRRRRERDQILAEPVADELAWRRRLNERVRKHGRVRARTGQPASREPRSGE